MEVKRMYGEQLSDRVSCKEECTPEGMGKLI